MRKIQILMVCLLTILAGSCTKPNEGYKETNMEYLVVPASFNFESVWNIDLTINDGEQGVVYEIYSMNSTDEPEVIYTAEDTIIKIDNSNQLLSKAFIRGGSWNDQFQVPSHLDYIYLRRRVNGSYTGIPLQITSEQMTYTHTGMKASMSVSEDILYVVNYKKQYFTFNLSSSEKLSEGELPKGSHSCAIDKANGILYFLNYQKPRELFALNLASDEISTVGLLSKAHIRMAYNPSDGLIYLSNKKYVYTYDPALAKYMASYKLTGDSNGDGGGDICINEDGAIFIVSKNLYALDLDGNNNKATTIGSKLPAAVNGADFASDGYIYGGRGNGVVYRIDPNSGTAEQVANLAVTIGDFAILLKDAEEQNTDLDGDGVPNDSDDYPEDATKAFNSYFPGARSFGTLAFEDLWPSRGDYDFNDMVVDYRFNHIKNADNLIMQLDITIQLRAIGGSLANGFGIQLPITSSQISSVSSDYSFSGDLINFDEKGLESGQALATLIFFENGFKVLQHPGIGTGINTSNENPFVEPAEIIVSVVFTQGLTIQQLGNAPNNPFIFSSEIRGKEIHIPGYAPTSLVDVSYFGTEDDATNLETEYYYKTPRGLPWGMNIPTSFSYPVEKIPIIDGYSNFSQWATSGGYSFMDWYDDIEGYRVAGKLFIRPN